MKAKQFSSLFLGFATLVLAAVTARIHAADTRVLPFQGRLSDASGNSLPDSARVVQFKIYDAPVGGRAVWNGEVQNLTVNSGLVSTLLGTKATLSGIDFAQDLYLELTIDANADGQISLADPPLLPRQSILPAVFARESSDSRRLGGYGWSALFGPNNPADGTLLESKIADSSLTTAKIRDAAMTTTKIADGAITAAKIANGAITAAKLDPTTIGVWTLSGDNVFRSAGNVGIGTSNPGFPLDVAGTARITSIGEGAVALWLDIERSWAFRQLGSGAGTALELASVGGEGNKNFVINTTGRVGIGTTAPEQKLHVVGNILATGNVGIGTSNPEFPLDVAGPARISSMGDGAVALNISIERSWAFRQLGEGSGTALELASVGGGGNKNFVITTIGGVGIGRNPAANALEVEGRASKTVAGSWLANSDARIKTDVRTVTRALEKLERVRPVQFRYTAEYRARHPSIEDRPYLNVVAQEFQQVFPEAVKHSGDKLPNGDDILQVDTYPLTIYSAAAIQELNQKVEVGRQKAEARVQKLEAENAELKARLERLERLLNTGAAGEQ